MEIDFLNKRIIVKIFNKEFKDSTHKYILYSNSHYEEIKKNHFSIIKKMSADHLNIMNQVHKDGIILLNKKPNSIDDCFTKPQEGDAIITNISNEVLGVLTADCVPVLLFSENAKTIAAIHCGWRSAFAKIIHKTARKIRDLQMVNNGLTHNIKNESDIFAVIGPSILRDSYEVDSIFYSNFLSNDHNNKEFFLKKDDGKFFFDLVAYVKYQLSDANIKLIHHFKEDTYSNPEKYPSYRFQTHNNFKDPSRILSTILIRQ